MLAHPSPKSSISGFSELNTSLGLMAQIQPGSQPRTGLIRPSMSPPAQWPNLGRSKDSSRWSRMSESLSPRTSLLSMSPRQNPGLSRNSRSPSRIDSEQRSLPPRDISESSIEDAYVAFILYCNPGMPTSTDSLELRKCFRHPPKSDGKSFPTYKLWVLVGKLGSKELKTWTQLVLELGVEPPSTEKNQSTQKLQQYAVRLKRWMHAMHIDAFFEYCLGKNHNYYTQIPLPNEPQSGSIRDGVPAEEDLVLRALLPEWRPKRGRRKLESVEKDTDHRVLKHPRLDTSDQSLSYEEFHSQNASLFPQSAIPWSAVPDDVPPWAHPSGITAVSLDSAPRWASNNSHQMFDATHFRSQSRDSSPSIHYPRSALTPSISRSPQFIRNEPQSAVDALPSRFSHPRKRARRMVSSAWLNSGDSASSHRGRPPGLQSSGVGVFSAFSVPPRIKEAPAKQRFSCSSNDSRTIRGTEFEGRPGKLHLQVPQHTGAPVRLATPPTLLVNGRSDLPSDNRITVESTTSDILRDSTLVNSRTSTPEVVLNEMTGSGLPFDIEDIQRAFAGRLLGATMKNREKLLTLEEAKGLSNEVLKKLTSGRDLSQSRNAELVTYATLLGVAQNLGLSDGAALGQIRVTRTGSQLSVHGGENRQQFSLEWDITKGPLHAACSFADITLDEGYSMKPSLEVEERRIRSGESEDDLALRDSDVALGQSWKEKYQSLRQTVILQEQKLARLRRRVLEATLA